MNKEILIEIFKRVSLYDLSEAKFEYFEFFDEQNYWSINAIDERGRVFDAIQYDGNLFYMMNNGGDFSLLNPMIDAFEILIPYKQHEKFNEASLQGVYCPLCQALEEHDCFCEDEDNFCSECGLENGYHHKGCPYNIDIFKY